MRNSGCCADFHLLAIAILCLQLARRAACMLSQTHGEVVRLEYCVGRGQAYAPEHGMDLSMVCT
jgi:hypothetical protein